MCFVVLLGVGALGVGTVAAQPTPAAPAADASTQAESLFREANALVAQQKWAEAEAKLLAAWELRPTYDVAANLGHTQYRLRKLRDAAEHLDFAVRNWPLVGKREPRDLAAARLEELRKLLGVVTVKVSAPGAAVLVDGRRVGTSPIEREVFLDPGTRTIEAKLEGHEDAKQVVEATAGGKLGVELTLTPVRAPAVTALPAPTSEPPPASAAPPGGKRKPIIAAGIGLAAVGLGVGIGGAIASANNSSSAEEIRGELDARGGTSACNDAANAARCGEMRSAYEGTGTFRNVAIVGFVLAGAAAIGTAAYVLMPAGEASDGGVRAALSIGPGAGGVVVTGKF
jgi:hypothetical protein